MFKKMWAIFAVLALCVPAQGIGDEEALEGDEAAADADTDTDTNGDEDAGVDSGVDAGVDSGVDAGGDDDGDDDEGDSSTNVGYTGCGCVTVGQSPGAPGSLFLR